MSSYTVCALAVVALAAGANAGVCGNINSLGADECLSQGCRWSSNTCQEPAECRSSGTVQYRGQSTGVRAERKPVSPEISRLCDADSDCTAIYSVSLDYQFTTGPPNCNDIAMLPPHGVDQTLCNNTDLFRPYARNLNNYVGHPYPTDGVKQSVAASKNAVTALTEETNNCFSNDRDSNANCAFPLGFYSDTIKKNKKICVKVRNVRDKWVEIMGSTRSGSDASFCVADRLKDAAAGGDKGCTKAGDLIDIRESGQSVGTDEMFIEFFTEDNFDDANIDFQWRVTGSLVASRNDGNTRDDPDAEDWSQHRDGADFPMSLMKPYPEGYDGQPVFETQTGSSAMHCAPTLLVVLAAALIAALC